MKKKTVECFRGAFKNHYCIMVLIWIYTNFRAIRNYSTTHMQVCIVLKEVAFPKFNEININLRNKDNFLCSLQRCIRKICSLNSYNK